MPIIEPVSIDMNKILPIIFIIDASVEMQGERIEYINKTLDNLAVLLSDEKIVPVEVDIKIGIVKSATDAEWITNGIVSLSDFKVDTFHACGESNLGLALEVLSDRMTSRDVLSDSTGYYAPILVFVNGTRITDDYKRGFSYAQQNKWFKAATKIGLKIGEDADLDALIYVTGTQEAVIGIDFIEEILIMCVKSNSCPRGIVNDSYDKEWDEEW